MSTIPLARRAVLSRQGARRLHKTGSFLRQRLTLNQLAVLAPRLALHAVPLSSAAELTLHSESPSGGSSAVRSVRPSHQRGELWPGFSAKLTTNDGAVMGRLLLFTDDRRGFDATSERTASALAGQLQAALRRAADREAAWRRTSTSPAASPSA